MASKDCLREIYRRKHALRRRARRAFVIDMQSRHNFGSFHTFIGNTCFPANKTPL